MWEEALTVAGIGLVNVFLVLAILALAVYGVGFCLRLVQREK